MANICPTKCTSEESIDVFASRRLILLRMRMGGKSSLFVEARSYCACAVQVRGELENGFVPNAPAESLTAL